MEGQGRGHLREARGFGDGEMGALSKLSSQMPAEEARLQGVAETGAHRPRSGHSSICEGKSYRSLEVEN